MAATLYRLMDVEVKDAQRSDFTYDATICCDKQLACADLEQANHGISLAIHSHVQTLIVSKESNRACDSSRELLRF